ncbi:MAG: CRISPR-associated endonuclease Cas2 [Candidatus Schekmanbacteria bacterium]|nr:CRISPR-associated endonuclease Cas2 [Candidatus Schekmanbacteria bacterium]
MYIVVSYDVVSDRRRAEVAKVLEDTGRRVQKSVFECRIDERALLRLRKRLAEAIDQSEDSVRFYRLCQRCVTSLEVLGQGTLTADEDVIVV